MHVLEIVSLMFREQVHVTLLSFLCTQLKAICTLFIKNLDSTHRALQSESRELLIFHVSLETVEFLKLILEDICLKITRHQTIIP